jgi:3',5'-cyclic AMP phosphodiesterase CpdA
MVQGFDVFNFRNLNRHGEVGEFQRGSLLAMQTELKRRVDPDFPDYRYDESFKLVLMHHHLFSEDGRVASTHIRDAGQTIDLFNAMNIDLVLCGHEHFPFARNSNPFCRFRFSCAGSATKQDEQVNSFKVYHMYAFNNIEMETFWASSRGDILTYRPQKPRVLLV